MDSKLLETEKVQYLLDDVIIRSLASDFLQQYNGFCEALKESENTLARKLAQDLM